MFFNRSARAAIAAATLLTLAGGPAMAKKVKVAPGEPPITVDIPATRKVSESKRGIQAKTADDEVSIWLESYKSTQDYKLMSENETYLEAL